MNCDVVNLPVLAKKQQVQRPQLAKLADRPADASLLT